ncbi:Nodal modulator [Tyrophagus putrescentiae]|nr:Nodal modulator [Tyrophagus putrescentiae]
MKCRILRILWCCLLLTAYCAQANDVTGCGGFVVSSVNINYSPIKIKLYTGQGVLKFQTDCAPNNGYYFIPLMESHGDYVVQIEGPKGWSFEPTQVPFYFDGKTDICSKQTDVNFVFKGFSIFGKVFSSSSSNGPSGVQVTLKANNNVIKHNTTQLNGLFTFTDILPNKYVIEASHEDRTFEQNRIVVDVSNDNVNLQNIEDPAAHDQIRVLGYSVKGKVVSDGQPIKGVQFALFAKNSQTSRKISCGDSNKPSFLSKLTLPSQLKYLCHALSDADGVFKLKALPVGQYVLYTSYEAQNIRFEVTPNKYDFEVKHDDVQIIEPFQIGGFTIFGSVINPLSPQDAVKGAEILLLDKSGKNEAIRVNVDQSKGTFSVDNIKTSSYVIKTTAPHYQFEDHSLSISPNTPNLPVISPVKLEVCSKITFRKEDKFADVKLLVLKKETKAIVESIAIRGEKVCLYLPGGQYIFKIESKYPELKFTPDSVEVPLTKPELNLAFEQFTASVSGKVELINHLQIGEKDLLVVLSRGQEQLQTATLEATSNNRYQFKFSSVLPGEYTLSLSGKLATQFCWSKDDISITIKDANIANSAFVQKGVYLQVSLSHSTDLVIQSPSGKKIKIAKSSIGVERIVRECVPEQGTYQIITQGCHKFSDNEQDMFLFDTVSMAGQIMTLTATQHLVSAKIKSVSNLSDLYVKIFVQSLTDQYEKSVALTEVQKEGEYWYSLSFYERPMVDIRLEPVSAQLLFKPAFYEFKLKDQCYEDVVTFNGRFGLFVNGQITPPIKDVTVNVIDTDTKQVIFVATSDSEGKYSGGPFDDDLNLKVEAVKNGYVMKTIPGKLGHFEAQKLCSIETTIVDQNGLPLSEVLVSLSGGENNFRKNSVASSDGKLVFENLHPGSYFFRVMRKEYEFEPTSKMLTIVSVVSSLNHEPEAGVIVEAIGLRNLVEHSSVKCSEIQEQAVTEADGSYRILGLTPECQFAIRLNLDENKHIRESMPKVHSVRVHDRDISDLRFIVLFKQFQMDVQLLSQDDSQSIIYKQSLNTSPFIYFPSIPLDQKQYTIRIDSDLSSALYKYSPIIYTFTANESYRHFQFEFAPTPRHVYSATGAIEQEISSNPLYSLPLLIIGILFYYNKQALEFVKNLAQYRNQLPAIFSKRNHSPTNGGDGGLRKKTKSKKAN